MLMNEETKLLVRQLDCFLRASEELFSKTAKNHTRGLMLENNYEIDYYCGRCFPVSKFVWMVLGAEDSGWSLMCIPSGYYVNGINSTHWYVWHKKHNIIIDLTATQFIYGTLPDYSKGVVKDFPHPKKGEKSKPSKEVARLLEGWNRRW